MTSAEAPKTGPGHPASAFSRKVLTACLIVIGLALLLVFLWFALRVLLLIFAGILLAVFLRTLSGGLHRLTRVPHGLCLLVVVVGIVGAFSGLGVLLAPRIGEQMQELAAELPRAVSRVRDWLETQGWAQALIPATDQLPEGGELLSRASGVVSSAVGGIVGVGVVLFVGLYLAATPHLYTRGLLRLVPLDRRHRASEVLGALGYTVRWWLFGQLMAMLAVGVMTTVGLFLLDVPLALTLGFLAFLLDFVPTLGPVVAAVPGVLLALVESPMKAVWVTLMYVGVQQVESLLITPLVQQRAVKLPPVVTLSALLLMGVLAGPLGVLLATPLTACVLVLVKMLYVEDLLGDRIDTPDDHMKEKDRIPLPKPDAPADRGAAEPA